MSERIEVGDLVMVVHTHCPHHTLGVPYVVSRLGRGCGMCAICKADIGAHDWAASEEGITCPLKWLKKIPPLTDPENVERKEELPA